MKRAVLSGFADESLPDLDGLLPPGFDTAWLAGALGQYRTSTLAAATMPTRDEELRYMQQAVAKLREARDLFGHQGLPPLGDATTHAAALKLGIDWSGLRRRLRADINQALSLVQIGAEHLAQSKRPKAGRPKPFARNELLIALVDRLRATPMSKKDAHGRAELILIRCRVPVPSGDAASSRRAMQRAVKRPK